VRADSARLPYRRSPQRARADCGDGDRRVGWAGLRHPCRTLRPVITTRPPSQPTSPLINFRPPTSPNRHRTSHSQLPRRLSRPFQQCLQSPSLPLVSRPVEDCEGCPPLAGVRNLALDDPRAVRPDSHCNFGDPSIRRVEPLRHGADVRQGGGVGPRHTVSHRCDTVDLRHAV